MPRPQKKRYVCREPDIRDFGPENPCGQISLSVDEYESIRLIDLENYTQEECAEQMCVSRTTVQGVYDAARKKDRGRARQRKVPSNRRRRLRDLRILPIGMRARLPRFLS